MKILSDITQRIESDFKDCSQRVLNEIANYLSSTERKSHRVLRCAIFLAKGNPDTLAEIIRTASIDYRDVIFWAEYIDHDREKPRRIRDFSKPFGDHRL